LRRVLAYQEKFNRRPGRAMAGGRGLPLPGAPVVWRLADAVHEPVLYLSENKTGNRHVQTGRVGRIPQQRPPGEKGLTLNI